MQGTALDAGCGAAFILFLLFEPSQSLRSDGIFSSYKMLKELWVCSNFKSSSQSGLRGGVSRSASGCSGPVVSRDTPFRSPSPRTCVSVQPQAARCPAVKHRPACNVGAAGFRARPRGVLLRGRTLGGRGAGRGGRRLGLGQGRVSRGARLKGL